MYLHILLIEGFWRYLIRGFSGRDLLNVILLAPRIFRLHLDFCRICAPLPSFKKCAFIGSLLVSHELKQFIIFLKDSYKKTL